MQHDQAADASAEAIRIQAMYRGRATRRGAERDRWLHAGAGCDASGGAGRLHAPAAALCGCDLGGGGSEEAIRIQAMYRGRAIRRGAEQDRRLHAGADPPHAPVGEARPALTSRSAEIKGLNAEATQIQAMYRSRAIRQAAALQPIE